MSALHDFGKPKGELTEAQLLVLFHDGPRQKGVIVNYRQDPKAEFVRARAFMRHPLHGTRKSDA